MIKDYSRENDFLYVGRVSRQTQEPVDSKFLQSAKLYVVKTYDLKALARKVTW